MSKQRRVSGAGLRIPVSAAGAAEGSGAARGLIFMVAPTQSACGVRGAILLHVRFLGYLLSLLTSSPVIPTANPAAAGSIHPMP